MDDCALCKLEKLTHWYFEDDEWVICDCLTCTKDKAAPMIVYRQHYMPQPFLSTELMIMRAKAVCEIAFGDKFSHLGKNQRQIKDHFHLHIYLKE